VFTLLGLASSLSERNHSFIASEINSNTAKFHVYFYRKHVEAQLIGE